MKTQYWMLNKYNGDVLHKNPLWELSKGEYKNEDEVRTNNLSLNWRTKISLTFLKKQ